MTKFILICVVCLYCSSCTRISKTSDIKEFAYSHAVNIKVVNRMVKGEDLGHLNRLFLELSFKNNYIGQDLVENDKSAFSVAESSKSKDIDIHDEALLVLLEIRIPNDVPPEFVDTYVEGYRMLDSGMTTYILEDEVYRYWREKGFKDAIKIISSMVQAAEFFEIDKSFYYVEE